MSDRAEDENWQIVHEYHERTKHHFHRYARSLGYMDWATQPDPFRRYIGAEIISLPIPKEVSAPTLGDVFENRVTPRELSKETVSEFLYYSMALSAWKRSGASEWALRVNPSSGNLHPTEAYLLTPSLADVSPSPSLFHYAPKEHALELRSISNSNSLFGQLGDCSFLVGLSSVHWREVWKYGERGFRYCQHDVGHALAALRISAARLGWHLSVLDFVADAQISRLLGLGRIDEFTEHECEHPDLLALVTTEPNNSHPAIDPDVFAAWSADAWFGKPNRLSDRHHEWPIIERVTNASQFLGKGIEPAQVTPPSGNAITRQAPQPRIGDSKPAGILIRQRRSAVDMDGQTSIGCDQFYAMLSRIMPRPFTAPWDAIPWLPLVHLGVFVHRVEGLEPGLYFVLRNEKQFALFRKLLRDDFEWHRPDSCPLDLPLYRLRAENAKQLSAQVSCHQDIAADGAFSLGMLAEFDPFLKDNGAHWYRRLFWETGVIGQVLYLMAEAVGIRATGIGCFFDDAVHEAFGLKSQQLQSLYHFTVGQPVEDSRILSLPAYR